MYGGRDGMGLGKAVAVAATVLGSKSGRVVHADAEQGVCVPLWSSFCDLSSDEPVGLRIEFQTST